MPSSASGWVNMQQYLGLNADEIAVFDVATRIDLLQTVVLTRRGDA